MCLRDVGTKGEYNILKTHGRTHVRWQVQRHHITSALKHGGGKVPLVEINIRPTSLSDSVSGNAEKCHTERGQVLVQVAAQTARLKPSLRMKYLVVADLGYELHLTIVLCNAHCQW